MDIHRCRFVPYPPSTINVLAFSHSQVSRGGKAADLRLAIGRANGNIEIWNPLNGAWLQETILRGGKDRSVDGLVWIQDPNEQNATGKNSPGRLRLFSIGYSTTVTEWDLERGQPLRQSSGNHGEIWCLAAQPLMSMTTTRSNGIATPEQWSGQNLITGCTDGAVVLYSTADEDLKLQRVLVRPSSKKAKVISVTFQDRNVVVAGCTDSTIRIYDTRTGKLVRSMSLGVGPTGAPKEIIIWTVKCLPNGHIVSGDSTGEMRIWDGKTYTLVQRVKSHKQDILSLATSNDGSMIFSGGMDRRTVVYKQTGGSKSRWGEMAHRRFHSHDVKTMATFEGMGMSIVASGGPDGSPIVLPLREFGLEHQRMLPCLPQEPAVQSATEKRLLMSWWDREICIWRINKASKPHHESSGSDSEAEKSRHSRKLVARVLVKGEANITSASIASHGRLLAVSNSAEIKLFRLYSQRSGDSDALKVKKLDVSTRLSAKGARLLQFSPDGHWLGIVRRDNRVVIARVVEEGSTSFRIQPILGELNRLSRDTDKRPMRGGLGTYDRTITRLAFSSDSRILAVSDLAGFVDTWVLEGHENLAPTADDENSAKDASLPSSSDESGTDDDSERKPIIMLGQHWIRNPSAALLPRLPSTAVVLCFRPANAGTAKAVSDAAVILHATRNNPDPHSYDLPQGDDRLMVMTASGVVMEFKVMQGSLSAWSRRNPTSSFPREFNRLRDQAMGCLWDVGKSKERLWLYGSSWLWMFDLSQDFPTDAPTQTSLTNGHINGTVSDIIQPQPNKRRKLNSDVNNTAVNLNRATSGAGGALPDSELLAGMSRRHQIISFDQDGKVKESIAEHRRRLSGMDLDDSDEEMGGDSMDSALKRLRRGENAALTNGDGQLVKNGDIPHTASLRWWHTYKYRPIMGIVPIDNGEAGLEVALVERPLWETDLPPRYYGDQDWEKPGL